MADAALQILHDKAGLDLPANEAVNIAMHFINAEAESGDIHSLMLSMQIISDVNKIVEESLHIKLDKDNYNYNRFDPRRRHEEKHVDSQKINVLFDLITHLVTRF